MLLLCFIPAVSFGLPVQGTGGVHTCIIVLGWEQLGPVYHLLSLRRASLFSRHIWVDRADRRYRQHPGTKSLCNAWVDTGPSPSVVVVEGARRSARRSSLAISIIPPSPIVPSAPRLSTSLHLRQQSLRTSIIMVRRHIAPYGL